MSLSLDSKLVLVPLVIRRDKKNYIVEDQTTGEFYEMPAICIDAIQLISEGNQLKTVEETLIEKYPNEEVDLLDFSEQLLDLRLVAEIDGVKVKVKAEQHNKENHGFLSIPPLLGKIFFNRLSYALYAILFIVNLFLFLVNPSLFPEYKDLFIFDFMALNITVWMIISLCLVLIHEFGHILAMRAHGLPTKLEIGHRLFLVVLETDMSSVWKIPSKNRNILYSAGLCFDTTILFLALAGQLIFAEGPALFLNILNVIVLDTFIRMVYQCCIYMKTDLYYVFENISGCYNLMENAQQIIRKWLPFLKFSGKTEAIIYNEERKTIFLYAIFYFVGVLLTLALFAFYYIPQLLFAWGQVLPGFWKAPTTLQFWDAMIFSVQIFIVLLLLLYSWRRKYLQKYT